MFTAVPPPSESSLQPLVARSVLSHNPRVQIPIQVHLEPLVLPRRNNLFSSSPRYLEGQHQARIKVNLRVRTSKAYLDNSSPSRAYSDNSNPSRAYQGNSNPSRAYSDNSNPSRAHQGNSSPSRAYSDNSNTSRAYQGNSSPSRVYSDNSSPSSLLWLEYWVHLSNKRLQCLRGRPGLMTSQNKSRRRWRALSTSPPPSLPSGTHIYVCSTHIQGRIQISNDLKARSLDEAPTKGAELIRKVHNVWCFSFLVALAFSLTLELLRTL